MIFLVFDLRTVIVSLCSELDILISLCLNQAESFTPGLNNKLN